MQRPDPEVSILNFLSTRGMDSVPDAGPRDRANRRHSSRGANYSERSMDGYNRTDVIGEIYVLVQRRQRLLEITHLRTQFENGL